MSEIVLFGPKCEWIEPSAESVAALTDVQRDALDQVRAAFEKVTQTEADLKAANGVVADQQRIHVAAMTARDQIVPENYACIGG